MTVLLSSLLENYYSYRKIIVLMVFITIITILLQIMLMLYEYNKNVPLYFMHKLYWMLLLVILGVSTTISMDTRADQPWNYLPELFRLIVIATLNIYTFCVRRQDIYDFENQPFFSS